MNQPTPTQAAPGKAPSLHHGLFRSSHKGLKLFHLVFLTVEAYNTKRMNLQAAALAYYTLLSLIPFLALLFAILKAFGLDTWLQPLLLRTITAGHKVLAADMAHFVTLAHTAMLGGVGILTLFVTGFLLLQRVRISLNMIWEVTHRPAYGQRVVEFMAVLSITPFLVLISFAASTYLRTSDTSQQVQELASELGLSLHLASLSSYPVFWLLLFYAYYFLPETKVRWNHALFGAVVAGTMANLVENLYVVTMLKITSYQAIYGVMTVLPFLMIWVYMGWLIFLLGAQLSCVSQHYQQFLGKKRLSRPDEVSLKAYLALRVLSEIDRQFRQTREPAQLKKVARALELPVSYVLDTTRHLTQARLVTPIKDTEEDFVPGVPLGKLTVYETLQRLNLLPTFYEFPPLGDSNPATGLVELFKEANQAKAKVLKKITVAQVVEELALLKPFLPPKRQKLQSP